MRGRRAALWTVYVVISAYSMAYMAQVPLLPYLLKEMGSEGSASYGTMQTAFSLAQLLGGLVSGPLLDRWGAQSMLLVSLGSAAANYFFTASATSVNVLYISRVCAVMQHALLAARTFVAANAPAENRVRVLSLLSVFNSMGFAAGPALGGALSLFGIRTTAWVATVASLLSMLAVVVMVPGKVSLTSAARPPSRHASESGAELSEVDSEQPGNKAQPPPTKPKAAHSWLQSLQVWLTRHSLPVVWARLCAQSFKVLKYPAVKQLMIVNLAYNLATGLIQCVFALMLAKQYGLSSKHNGMVMSYQGILGMASQAFLVEPIRRRLGEGGSVYAACVGLGASYIFLGLTSGSVVGLLAALLPSALASAILSTVLTAQLTRAAPQQVVGSVLALDMSLFAAVRLVTPAIATALLDRGGVYLGFAAASLVGLLLLVVHLGWVRCDGGLPPTAPKYIPIKVKHEPESPPPAPRQEQASGADSVTISVLHPWVKWAARDMRSMQQLPLRARV